jgi:hypothetical protein
MADRVPFSVLLVSGPNLVSFAPLDPDPKRFVAMINQLTPVARLHHLYRYRSTTSMKRRFSPLIGSVDLFSQSLCRISGAVIGARSPTVFESQVSRVFHTLPGSSAHLFTLADGDTSHLRIISEQAAVHDIRINVHIPKGAYDRERFSQSVGAPVEVI